MANNFTRNSSENMEVTDNTNVTYSTLVSGDGDRKDFYTGKIVKMDTATGESEVYYTTDWALWWGYYINHPELSSSIDTLKSWVVSEIEADKKTKDKLGELIGDGKSTHEEILENIYQTSLIGGDGFGEKIIVGNKFLAAMKRLFGRKITWNVKPINPDNVKVVFSEKGFIKGYDLIGFEAGKEVVERRIKPNEMFHVSHNKVGSEIHGTPMAKKLIEVIQAKKEIMDDMRVVFHRYVKPMLLISAKTDDLDEVADIAAKIKTAYQKTENIVMPSEVIDNVESISIPKNSTLDPLPWVEQLTRSFTQASRVPEIIGGWGGSISEAGGKIVYLSFESFVKDEQRKYALQIKNQLELELKFKAPASLEPVMERDNKKDGGQEVKKQEAGKNQK